MESIVPAVSRHLDEIEAAHLGEQFLREQANRYGGKGLMLRRVSQPDDGERMLPFKGAAVMDGQDRMLACYLMNRDCFNWTRLTLVTMPDL